MKNFIEVTELKKVFGNGEDEVHAFGPATININSGEFVSVLGPSGCGKSTLMLMVAGLLDSTRGKVEFANKLIAFGVSLAMYRRLPTLAIIIGLGLLPIESTVSFAFKPVKDNTYKVKVIKILDFGAVVEYLDAPGNEVLLHVSEIAWERTENVSDVLKLNDIIDVKYFGFDPRTKKEKISRKALITRPSRNNDQNKN